MNLSHMVKKQPFLDALVAFLVICQLSFTLLVGDLFVTFLQVLYPKISDLIPSSSNTLRSYVMDMFTERKKKLKTALHNSPSLVHFSFDLWTSPNHLALLGVVAHYIDEDNCSQSVSHVLAYPLPKRHFCYLSHTWLWFICHVYYSRFILFRIEEIKSFETPYPLFFSDIFDRSYGAMQHGMKNLCSGDFHHHEFTGFSLTQ